MKRDLVLMGIVGFLVADTYYDGKYSKKFKSYKKYYKISVSLLKMGGAKAISTPELKKKLKSFLYN